MHQKIIHFIKYHNALTIAFVICFFGFGVSFAAKPDLLYSSEDTVVSIDNGALVTTNLDNLDFNLTISSVTEDEENYYVAYSYQTLILEDGVWRYKQVEKVMEVNKEALGERDLGLYVAEQLGENLDYELSYLKRAQQLAKEEGKTNKMVTTKYSGLIGKLLNPHTAVIEGYDPVVKPPKPKPKPTPAAIAASTPEPEESGPQEITSPSGHTFFWPETDTSDSTDEATSTPEETGEESTQATSTPAVEETTTSTPEVVPEPEPEPEDVCPNIDEIQETIPEGMIQNDGGDCVEPEPEPEDVCPNIEDIQETIPEGLVKDNAGDCVESEPEPEPEDVCPNIDGIQETIPEGLITDDEGNCVEPEPEPEPENE